MAINFNTDGSFVLTVSDTPFGAYQIGTGIYDVKVDGAFGRCG